MYSQDWYYGDIRAQWINKSGTIQQRLIKVNNGIDECRIFVVDGIVYTFNVSRTRLCMLGINDSHVSIASDGTRIFCKCMPTDRGVSYHNKVFYLVHGVYMVVMILLKCVVEIIIYPDGSWRIQRFTSDCPAHFTNVRRIPDMFSIDNDIVEAISELRLKGSLRHYSGKLYDPSKICCVRDREAIFRGHWSIIGAVLDSGKYTLTWSLGVDGTCISAAYISESVIIAVVIGSRNTYYTTYILYNLVDGTCYAIMNDDEK